VFFFVGTFGTRIDDAAIVVSVRYRFTMPSVDSPCVLGRVEPRKKTSQVPG
jgi:hypothetical protein